MKFRVEVTANAEDEIAQIFAWIAPQAPENALRWLERLEAAIAGLTSMPRRGRIVPEQREFDAELRQVLFGDYRVIYSIDRDLVNVLHVRHLARDQIRRPDPLG